MVVSVRRSCRHWENCSSDLSRALSTSCDSIAYPVRQSYSIAPGKRDLHRQQADCGAPRRRRTPNFQEDVLHRIENTPSMSTRTIERRIGLLHSTVWWVLHEQQLHPYHPQMVHPMGAADFAVLITVCGSYNVVRENSSFHDSYSSLINLGSLRTIF